MLSISIQATYEQFEIDSLLEESVNSTYNSVEDEIEESSNNARSALKCEARIDRNPSFLVEVASEQVLETEPDDDATANSSIVKSNEIECDTIAIRNIPDARNPNNG